MKNGSAFSGIAGIDLGFEQAGIETAWQIENDAQCAKLLAARFPKARLYGDIRSVGGIKLPAVDILSGGFPCQDLSVAGKRAGLAGDRSGLWFEFRRIAASLRPTWILIENVPGLYSSWSPIEPTPGAPGVDGGPEDGTWDVEEDSDLAVVIEGLVELGYGVAWRCLDAQYFGVAQRRRRVFIVGCLGDAARAAQVLFEPESCSGNPAPRRPAQQEAASASRDGAEVGRGYEISRRDGSRPTELSSTLTGREGLPGGANQADTFIADTLGVGRRGVDVQGTYLPEVVGALTVSQDNGSTGNSQVESGQVIVAAPLTAGGHPDSNEPGRHREDDENLIPEVVGSLDAGGSGGPRAHGGAYQGYTAQGAAQGLLIPSVTHTLRSEGGDASEDGTGRGTPMVISLRGREGGNMAEVEKTGVMPALRQGDGGSGNPMVAFTQNHRDEVRIMGPNAEGDHVGALPSQPGAKQQPYLAGEMAVRRLTPTECERLQGFPDGWTEGFSDSVRYRMLGNAVCVPVAAWIARRIAKVDAG